MAASNTAYSASNFNRRVTFQAELRTADGGGGYTSSWIDRQTMWAMMTPQSANQTWFGDQLSNARRYLIVVRWGFAVDPSMRIRYEITPPVYLKITGVLNLDESREYLQIYAEAEFQASD